MRAASSSPIDLADPGLVTVTITAKDSAGNPLPVNGACEGDALTVDVEFEHQIFMPFIPQLIGRPTLPLKATVTIRFLHQCKRHQLVINLLICQSKEYS